MPTALPAAAKSTTDTDRECFARFEAKCWQGSEVDVRKAWQSDRITLVEDNRTLA